MLKKANSLLNILISSFIGAFIGHSLYVVWDYKTHPNLYAMMSAPWYASILLYLLFTGVFVAAAGIIKLFICRKLK